MNGVECLSWQGTFTTQTIHFKRLGGTVKQPGAKAQLLSLDFISSVPHVR